MYYVIMNLPDSNAAGTYRLPLLALKNPAKLRAFKDDTLPVIYKAVSKQ